MSRHLSELETVLRSLVTEHQRLVAQLDAQQAAMRSLDLQAMDASRRQQESIRLRIAALESRRRMLATQLARAAGLAELPTLRRLAEMFVPRGPQLLELRDQLRDAINQVQQRTSVASRLAGAVLGHLNTAVRVLAGAVDDSGTYTKYGMTAVTRRIGVIEAIG